MSSKLDEALVGDADLPAAEAASGAARSDPSAASLAEFHAAVAACRDRGLRTIPFWWRDDDLVIDSDTLRRLSALSERTAVSPLMAIIPGHASPRLADTLAETSPLMWFAQHGFETCGRRMKPLPPGCRPAAPRSAF